MRDIPCDGDIIMESEERIITRQFNLLHFTFNIFIQTLLVTIANIIISFPVFYDNDERRQRLVPLCEQWYDQWYVLFKLHTSRL